MAKAFPDRVKRNFIYKIAWTNVFRRHKDAVFIFIGDRGDGKSVAALRFGQDLDPNFSAKRVVHRAIDFMKLLNSNLPVGSVIVFDEIAGSDEGAHSRRSMSKVNLILSWTSQTMRYKKYIIIFTCTTLKRVDTNVRDIITGVMEFKGVDFEKKMSLATFRVRISFPIDGKIIMPYERIVDEDGKVSIPDRIWVTKPGDDLIEEYEKKRAAFMGKKYKYYERLLGQMESERASKAKPSFKDWFEEVKIRVNDFLDHKRKRVLSGKLLIAFESEGMGTREAMRLARVLNDNIKSGAIKI